MHSFLNSDEIESLKLASVGENVLISRHALILGPKNISISDNVRIDPFTVLSAKDGKLNIGKFVHIGSHSLLICSGGIEIDDYASISSNVQIFSGSDDFSGNFLTNPTIDPKFRNVKIGLVKLNSHTIIGSGSVILPNLKIGNGVAVGALSLVDRNLDEWTIYSGNPIKYIRPRSKELLKLEMLLREQN